MFGHGQSNAYTNMKEETQYYWKRKGYMVSINEHPRLYKYATSDKLRICKYI